MSWKAAISRNLQSIKVLACPVSASSAGARTFWESQYKEISHLNPRFPFLLRAHPDAEPSVIVEYDFGRKMKMDVANLTPEQIEDRVKAAVAEGAKLPRSYDQSYAPLTLPSVVE